MSGDRFVEPDWMAPIDLDAYVAGIPEGAIVKGVFPSAVADAARRKGKRLTYARERYHAFGDVPLREYVPMLAECATALYPELPLRGGLRKLGRASLDAIARSTIGRILMTNLLDVTTSLAAVGKAVAITTPGASISVSEIGPNRAVVKMSRIYTFFDSHHVGILEKVASAANVHVRARISAQGPYDGEIELLW
jgi:uncharacterized protein (TIGR02265 family)